MINKYIELVTCDIRKYYKNFFEFDYEKIIEVCMQRYKEFKTLDVNIHDKNEFKSILFFYIISLTKYLDKKKLKKFIKYIKKTKWNKIFVIPVEKPRSKLKIIRILKKLRYCFIKNDIHSSINNILIYFFPTLYIKKYLLNNGKLNNKCNKSNNKKIQYYLNSHDSIILKLKKYFFNYLVLDYIELVITTKCSLKCKDCANLMYKYKTPYDVDFKIIKESIKKLLECTDLINVFRILGGEPFCNQNLKYILRELNSKKIKKIIIVTNGTIIPRDKELINELQNDNVYVYISDYKNLSFNKNKLITLFKENNIKYIDDIYIKYWLDYGDLKKYNNDVSQQFYYCDNNCKSILNGKIYYCPRLAHGIDLNIIKSNPSEYIDLINNNEKTNKKLIKKYIFRNNPISACNYCKYATKNCKLIDIAIQIKK